MSDGGARKSRKVLKALLKIGWTQKRQTGSHRVLSRTQKGVIPLIFEFERKMALRLWLVTIT